MFEDTKIENIQSIISLNNQKDFINGIKILQKLLTNTIIEQNKMLQTTTSQQKREQSSKNRKNRPNHVKAQTLPKSTNEDTLTNPI